MKTKLFTLLLAVVASVGTMFASDTQVDGIWYNFNNGNLTAEVTYQGAESYSSDEYSGEVVIPASVTYNDKTYTVTSIGMYAFGYCSSLTSVTIPNSVTSIGGSAFFDCTGLTSVTIPNSVTSIGDLAFQDCSGLTSLYVEAGNTVYDSRNNCNAIIKTSTNTLIFGCQNTTIPNSVTSIGRGAFRGCSGLTSVTIPNSVTSIGKWAFGGCISLTSVTIPNSVTNIGDDAFRECSGLTSVTIGNSVTSIGNDAFLYCSSLTSVTIPNSVTSIGEGAFLGCDGLTSVTIGNSVTSIGDYAFSVCRALTSVTIGNSVTSIGNSAFAYCSGLTSVTIEAETPPTLGDVAFYNTNSPIYVPCGTIDSYKTAWSDYASRIQYVPLPYTIAIQAENGNVTTTDVATLTICDEPFITCTATPDYGYHFTQWSDGLKDNPRIAQITQDTTFTAEFAYDRVGTCGKDLALVWSYDPTNKVLTIGNAGSFTENMQFGVEAPTEMEELVIGNSVTAIGANAFAGIETLKKVSIGESVKTIGEQAFYNCVNLETIFNYRPTPTNTYSNAFDGVDKFECTLYVLPNSIDMYKAAAVWRDFYYTYAIGAEEATVTTNDVQVEPQNNAATLTWPTNENAASYTIQITKDGVVFCTLVFNANGQLTGIAFAPSRDGSRHAPSALMTANGLQFTVTGLDSNTQYGYSVTAEDANDQPVATYSGEFTTTSEVPTSVDQVPSDQVQYTKILRNGQILILRGEKVYTIDGRLVR